MAKSVVPSDFDVRHNPKRRGYDLGENVKFSAAPSQLLPVWHRTVMPGEKVRISVEHKSRTMPVNTAAYTNIREYFDFFFVPYSYLWKNAKQVHTNNTQNPVVATNQYTNLSVGKDVPHFNIDEFYNSLSSIDDSQPRSIFNRLGYDTRYGIDRSRCAAKLLNYLGYGYVDDDTLDKLEDGSINDDVDYNNHGSVFGSWTSSHVCAYPLLAYNAIYYNFYRNKQWENNVPYNYNVDYLSGSALLTFNTEGNADYWSNPTMFDLRYSNYPKDLLFGIIPDTQYGDVAVVDVKTSFDTVVPANLNLYMGDGVDRNSVASPIEYPDAQGLGIPEQVFLLSPQDDYSDVRYDSIYAASGTLTSRINSVLRQSRADFDILSLRYSNFLQKYREILGSGDLDYQTIVKKLFGVDVSDIEEGCPRYIGGDSSSIIISEVINNNLSESEAMIKGKGEAKSQTGTIEFDSRGEYGIIMCIYHCQPTIDYAMTGRHFDVTKVESDDYANPVFDQLGFQELPLQYITTSRELRGYFSVLGYSTRYFDYKTGFDRTLGSFMEDSIHGSTSAWFAPVNENLLFKHTHGDEVDSVDFMFFKVSPHILDPIFTTKYKSGDTMTEPIMINAKFNVQMVRPLDYHGLPY